MPLIQFYRLRQHQPAYEALAVQIVVTQRITTHLVKVEPLIKSFISLGFLRVQSKIVGITLTLPIGDNKRALKKTVMNGNSSLRLNRAIPMF